MNKVLVFTICSLVYSYSFSQPNYSVSVNTNPSKGNLFFQTGGQPVKPISILDSLGALVFWDNLVKKGWDFKVNYNNNLTYFDRLSKGWFVVDSLNNVID
tara:strand:+ start:146 stop:445 length:300 start_codon:yes stop_codon:yes gene_type:complete